MACNQRLDKHLSINTNRVTRKAYKRSSKAIIKQLRYKKVGRQLQVEVNKIELELSTTKLTKKLHLISDYFKALATELEEVDREEEDSKAR